jgi:hypothetical protein
MDIARPEFKQQKRRRQIIWGMVGLVCLGGVTVGISRLEPATPEVVGINRRICRNHGSTHSRAIHAQHAL